MSTRTGEGSRWMLRYCRPRPLRPLPPFPHPGACRRGSTEIHRLRSSQRLGALAERGGSLASAEALEHLSRSRQRNESSPPCGELVIKGAQAVAARSPALPRKTRPGHGGDGGVAGTAGGGIPTSSSQHHQSGRMLLSSRFTPIDLKKIQRSNAEENKPGSAKRAPGRHQELPCPDYRILSPYLYRMHSNLSIQTFPHSSPPTRPLPFHTHDGGFDASRPRRM